MKWPKHLLKEAKNILEKIHRKNVFPTKEHALRFFMVDPSKIKIVVLGQDPYPTPNVANGRAFAVNKNCKIPQSLQNIFKEIKEIQGYVKTDETLEEWESQGVLLINTAFTVIANQPNSHQKHWINFSAKLIEWIDTNLNIVWILWGREAKKHAKNLINECIEDAHPSPLSYRRRNKKTFQKIDWIEW